MDTHLTETEIDLILSGGRVPRADAHVQECAACAETLAAERLAERVLQAQPLVPAPSHLHASVLADLPRRHRVPLWTAATGGLALSIWLAGTLGLATAMVLVLMSEVPFFRALADITASLLENIWGVLHFVPPLVAGLLHALLPLTWVMVVCLVAIGALLPMSLMLMRYYHRRLFTPC